MTVLRDIFRRRFRSLLTICGVAVGVFTLAMLGAVAEKAYLSMEYIGDYYDNRVTVVDEKDAGVFGLGGGNVPLPPETVRRLREMPGVERVDAGVSILLDEQSIPMGMPALIVGGAGLGPGEAATSKIEAAKGRLLEDGDRRVALIGKDLVAQLDAEVGETVKVRGEDFEVVGVLERSFVQLIDQSVIVPLADAQELFVRSVPEAFQAKIRPDDVVLQASVVAEDGADPDQLARRISQQIDGVLATGPTQLKASVDQIFELLALVVASVGAVALLVGALSVVNTMLVAVAERTYEVGVKRALGAGGRRIAQDVLFEAALMSMLGGVLGLSAAALVVLGVNAVTTAATGTANLYMTPRLALGAVAFAIVLGLIGGAYPARYASRLDPVEALARE